MQVLTKCFALCLSCLWLTSSLAQESAPWLDDQTVAVMKINCKDTPAVQLLAKLRELVPGAKNDLQVWQDQMQLIAQAITAAGGDELLVVYSLADEFEQQPLYVVPTSKGLKLESLQRSFLASGILNPLRKSSKLTSVELAGSTVVAADSVLSRVKANKTQPSADILKFEKQKTNSISMLATLSADQRRALGAMIPLMPAAFGGGRSSQLLSQIDLLRFDVNGPSTGASPSQLALTISGDQPAIQSRLKDIEAWIKTSESLPAAPVERTLAEYLIDQLISQPAKIDGRQAIWTIPIETALKSKLGTSLEAAIVEADQLTASMSLKIMALAMHNYYSAYQRFPGVKNRADGKPRNLSWRVDLLPFMGEQELYNQFHLDEAWDSPHNQKLVASMPEIYRCPHSKHATTTGLSTFVVPVHEQGMWPLDKTLDFKDITDGTSNTIMFVEVNDAVAQIWTKPTPFELNFDKLPEQIGGHFKGRVLFAAGDGSAQTESANKRDRLRAQFTRAGGEIITE